MKNCQKIIFLVLAVALCVSGCDNKKKKLAAKQQQKQIIVAKMETPIQRLYFTGDLAPIKTVAVISEMAGNITSVDFAYGQRVDDKQKLLVIDSQPLSDDYRKAVSDFLSKKQTFQTSKESFAGNEALYKAGVIPEATYISEKNTYENDSLAYLQSQYALEKVLRTANVDIKTIESLTLSHTQEVSTILQKHFRNIEILAPGAGVALFPTRGGMEGGGGSTGKIAVGAAVKQGQLLLSIGDLSGLSATFDVSEVDINRIKKDMAVIVTGSAFPGITLHGIISSVSAQANQGGGGGLSMFTVNIQIPQVDPKAMERIRVGMTAKFEIDIKSAPRIMLPVRAVFEKNGHSMVMLQYAAGVEKPVTVVTGDTTPTQVVIISGVHDGDKVVVND